jgi:hypothetical protein
MSGSQRRLAARFHTREGAMSHSPSWARRGRDWKELQPMRVARSRSHTSLPYPDPVEVRRGGTRRDPPVEGVASDTGRWASAMKKGWSNGDDSYSGVRRSLSALQRSTMQIFLSKVMVIAFGPPTRGRSATFLTTQLLS